MTFEDYSRWASNPDMLIPIMGEHGIVVETDDLKLTGLTIEQNIPGNDQESNFMNACLTGKDNVDISIAVTPPAAYYAMKSKEFNAQVQADLFRLVNAGWEFEIQRGPDETGEEKIQEQMMNAINAQT